MSAKAVVSLTAKVGVAETPSCSRTGSGQFTTDAFGTAKALLVKALAVHVAPDGEEILVKVIAGSKHAEGSATTLDAAIASAWRSLLENNQEGGQHAAR